MMFSYTFCTQMFNDFQAGGKFVASLVMKSTTGTPDVLCWHKSTKRLISTFQYNFGSLFLS